ncbi:flagellar basal body-associated FliL family protein [Hahella sp. SMD15-11]|uniref:Flagellar protein FliL n=1 Tax=Thermohahella caldifontis TaxID=3142973 RepID=A0AB39UWN1_9GAMM
MAEKEAPEATEEGEGKSGSKKMLIIILVVVILAAGGGVGVAWFLLSGDKSAEADKPAEPAAPVHKPALYFNIKPPIVVAFDGNKGTRYLQVSISVMGRDKEAIDGVELHLPVIRNRLINAIGSKDFASLMTPEAKEALRQECKDIINQVLNDEQVAGSIEEVLFTNLVMQ